MIDLQQAYLYTLLNVQALAFQINVTNRFRYTMVMIVADHVAVGAGHGGTDLEELTVPLIYFGAGIKNGYQIQQQIYQDNAAATIAFALQLDPL